MTLLSPKISPSRMDIDTELMETVSVVCSAIGMDDCEIVVNLPDLVFESRIIGAVPAPPTH
jgi:hypothetical protein